MIVFNVFCAVFSSFMMTMCPYKSAGWWINLGAVALNVLAVGLHFFTLS